MKTLGRAFLIAGFLVSAFATALHVYETNWLVFVPAALLATCGVIMIKRQSSNEARSEDVLTANRAELTSSLQNVVATLDELIGKGQFASVELRDGIDDRVRLDLQRFADARESLVHLFGMQTYANIMSEFAAGERYVNRVWSASADGYDKEASDYLQRAIEQFRDANEQLQQAQRGAA
ncbi:MAG: hypothetical protein RIA65_17650 [Woeseia sp.]